MKKYSEFIKKGDPYILLTSAGLVLTMIMVVFFLGIVLVKGLGIFWPTDLTMVKTEDTAYLGEFWLSDEEKVIDETGKLTALGKKQYKIGNRDVYGIDFVWINNEEIKSEEFPKGAAVIERTEYGNSYGFLKTLALKSKKIEGEKNVLNNLDKAFSVSYALNSKLDEAGEKLLELTAPLDDLKRNMHALESKIDPELLESNEEYLAMLSEELSLEEKVASERESLETLIDNTHSELEAVSLTILLADGEEKEIPLSEIVRIYQPNSMGLFEKTIHYIGKLWEFIFADPRESNTEGGVFPAIFGTVMMVIIMSVLVVPFGVMAAIYLNEYAGQNTLIRLIRLSVNNLAGVPSIVYGIFGLGFFVYIIGGSFDQLFFSNKLPEPTLGTGGILWAALTLALLTLPVVVVATEEGILAVPRANKEGALALGATKWQMIRKIVIPNAMPGILTGLILAISRGAGEVAPLMITGVVKLAPSMPLDGVFPYIHLDRKFMHLGFHIYDVGFQSPNVEAAKPMVYSTALLLIIIVVLLNLLAIYLRNSLRKKYKSASF